MQELNVNNINKLSPYGVRYEEGEYLFHSDYGVAFAVEFKQEDSFQDFEAYWFNLTNRSCQSSPNDSKVRATIICIIEEFFHQNPDILLYLCDTADDQQAMRSRLFLRWFNGYEQQQKYIIQSTTIVDEGIENHIAMIVQRSNPKLNNIIDTFEREINLFKELKP